jgi:hypothetical protein
VYCGIRPGGRNVSRRASGTVFRRRGADRSDGDRGQRVGERELDGVHQRIDTSTGDIFWVQSTTAPNTSAGTVDIHDSEPATDQWDYAGAEILPGS